MVITMEWVKYFEKKGIILNRIENNTVYFKNGAKAYEDHNSYPVPILVVEYKGQKYWGLIKAASTIADVIAAIDKYLKN
jgi:hypothetical protein